RRAPAVRRREDAARLPLRRREDAARLPLRSAPDATPSAPVARPDAGPAASGLLRSCRFWSSPVTAVPGAPWSAPACSERRRLRRASYSRGSSSQLPSLFNQVKIMKGIGIARYVMMSSSESSDHPLWDEEEEDDSGVDDILILACLREGSRRRKRKKKKGTSLNINLKLIHALLAAIDQ
ncbi:hypothetical protein EJB05_17889, partial [Eragrostis curvula]